MKIPSLVALLAAASFLPSLATAQQITPTTGITFPVLGKISPRAAKDIASSPWSVGAETLDRDFASYPAYKKFLGPLGAKGVRLQAGWAKCEKARGVYDFAWLDPIIDDAVAQGVRPWLEFSYGNPLYPGGGEPGLGGGFPSSPEALAAWDRWTRALVERYRDRVTEWEVWNEPDLNKAGTAPAAGYVELFIRTATMVRAVQPAGRVWALGLASSADYADAFLAGMAAKGKLDLIDAITFHGYPRNPDDTALVDRLRAVIAKHGRAIPIRQGETGAPSKYQENFALSKISFTETTHAKWDARRLLAHRAKDVPMNLFTLSDLHYTTASAQGGADGILRMNYKGLLATHPDQSVAYAKPAYTAAQTIFAIFDDTLVRVADFPVTTTALRGHALSGYRRERDGAQVVAVWFNDAPPAEANGISPADVTLRAGKFTEPVLVDVRTATVYAIPRDRWTQGEAGTVFHALPIYDSPLLIAEKSAVSITPR
jgi:Glycosyl hydrolases family 39